MDGTIAVILGGGRGSRLWPLTRDRSKPAVPLIGNYRLIDIPISNCINSGIRHIYVLTQFNSASLNHHIARSYRFDRYSSGFVEILAADQRESQGEWFQGTADAVRKSLTHIGEEPVERVLILSGDHLYRMDFADFVRSHRESRAGISIAAQPVSAQKASDLGILQADAEGRVRDFVEKPSPDRLPALKATTHAIPERPYLGSMGIYLFDWPLLSRILTDHSSLMDFGKDIIPLCISREVVNAYSFDGYWEDIGTIGAFFHANLEVCDGLPRFNLFDRKHQLYTDTPFLPPSKICDAHIKWSIVSDGVIIEECAIRRSVIGMRSRIFPHADLQEVVMMGADYYESEEMAKGTEPRLGVGEGSVIRRSILDKNVCIGNGVRLLNERNLREYDDPEGRLHVRDGIIVIPKKAVIPHGFVF
jgi:glucose-1-phosphate adenylyltransferase